MCCDRCDYGVGLDLNRHGWKAVCEEKTGRKMILEKNIKFREYVTTRFSLH